MPPGIGDATLDMIRLIPRIEFLVVTTPSRLAYESVRKLLVLLNEQEHPDDRRRREHGDGAHNLHRNGD